MIKSLNIYIHSLFIKKRAW